MGNSRSVMPEFKYHILTGPAFFLLTRPRVNRTFRYLDIVILLIPVFSASSTPDSPALLPCRRLVILCFTSSRVYLRYMAILKLSRYCSNWEQFILSVVLSLA